MDVVIREVTPKDFQQIFLLSRELGYVYPADKTESRIRHILENTKDIILVAERAGEVVGYIHACPYELMFSDSILSIMAFVVKENRRGNGIGRRLIAGVEKTARESGFAAVRLTSAMRRTEAHRFYEAHGYSGEDVKLFSKPLSKHA